MSACSNRPSLIPFFESPTKIPLAASCHGKHFVRFYEHDDFFTTSVGGYLEESLADERNVLVIAGPKHRTALETHLAGMGVDLHALTSEGRYVALDAAECLDAFRRNGQPDAALFERHISPWIMRLTSDGRELSISDEMVALLWADGNPDAAIRLEALWNALQEHHDFTLCCAYPMQGFADREATTPFRHICRAHSRVLPAESYPGLEQSGDDRLAAVALLQQKAASLENEIVEHGLADEALRRSEKELRAFVENATIGLHWIDPKGIILWANAAELAILGYPREEFIGRSIADFHADPQIPLDLIARVSRGETVRNCEARLRARDGVIKIVLIDSSAFCEDGRLVHTQCFTRDITATKSAELALEQSRAALAETNRELVRRVVERTQALQEANAQLEEFSSTVAHDLRAPLRGMQVYGQALLDDYSELLPPHARHCLRRIAKNADWLDRMVGDVLIYSHVSRAEIHLERVDLDRIVRDLLDSHPGLQQPRATIHVEPLADVIGHAPSVVQAVSNLLSNAVKFIAPGVQPQLRIWTDSREGAVRLWVEDNGIGIAPEHHAKLFRIFTRIHPTSAYEGTGIGLAIVRKAMSRMGGEAGLESDGITGTRAWLQFQPCPGPVV